MWTINTVNPIVVISPENSTLEPYYKKQGDSGGFIDMPITFEYKGDKSYEATYSFDAVGSYIIKIINTTINEDLYAMVKVVDYDLTPTNIAEKVWSKVL